MFKYLMSFFTREDPNEITIDETKTRIQYSFLSSDEVFYVDVDACKPKIKDIKALIKEKVSVISIDIVSELNGTVLEDEDTITNKSDILKIVKHPDTRTVPPSMITLVPDMVFKDRTEDGLLMACGCAMTPDFLFQYIEVELKRGDRILTCFYCSKELEFKDACDKAQMSEDEKKIFSIKISLNSVGDVCPSCKYYCQRITENNDIQLWIKCARKKCSFQFCWICRQEWTLNHKCKSYKLQDVLDECPKKVMEHSRIENVPSIRLCPNCHALIEHISGCKETKCTNCNKSFCFVCLTMCTKNYFNQLRLQCSDYNAECTVAPVQTA